MVLQELKDLLKESGIVGAGGAGFPTYAKLSYDVNTVILNGAECEPLFRVDQNLLATHTDEILAGLSLVVDAVGAKEGILAYKAHYHDADEAIEKVGQTAKLSFLLSDGTVHGLSQTLCPVSDPAQVLQ